MRDIVVDAGTSGGEQGVKAWDGCYALEGEHLMVNTNGVKIASDAAFAKRLADYMPGFELYLQFDSMEDAPLRELRGVGFTERAAECSGALE